MKLIIDNFQSISHAEVNLPQGEIVLITGPNSSGKSAILRSLYKGLCLNSVQKRHIKHGESSCKVSLDFDGAVYSYTRNATSATYEHNGEKVEKIGRKTVHDFFGDFPLVLDDRGQVLQVSNEWDKLFPYERTDTELFTLFEHVFQISDSAVITKGIKDDIISLTRKMEEKVNRYNTSVPIVNEYEKIEISKRSAELSTAWKELSGKLDVVRKISTDSETASVIDKEIHNIIDITPKEFELSVLSEVRYLQDNIKTFREMKNEYDIINSSLLEKGEFDFSKATEWFELERAVNELRNIKQMFESLVAIEKREFNMGREFIDLANQVNLLESIEFELGGVEEVLQKNISMKESVLEKLKDVKVCPLCKKPLDNSKD